MSLPLLLVYAFFHAALHAGISSFISPMYIALLAVALMSPLFVLLCVYYARLQWWVHNIRLLSAKTTDQATHGGHDAMSVEGPEGEKKAPEPNNMRFHVRAFAPVIHGYDGKKLLRALVDHLHNEVYPPVG